MSKNKDHGAKSGNAALYPESLIPSRRGMLKIIALGAVAAIAAPALFRMSAYAAEAEGGKVLIVYFSHSGHTRQLAGHIQERVGGDMVELKTVNPYPQDYNDVVDMAQREQQNDARPRISTQLGNFDTYDTVFLGYPNWWGTFPMPLFTFLETHDVGNKTIIPFCTHEGSRFGRSESDLKRLCPQARILKGFEVRGSRVSSAQNDVDEWLADIGMRTANQPEA